MSLLKRFVLAGALLAAGTGALAQDLLAVWRAAAGHDQRLAVARAEHDVSQTLREQADALWRPQISLSLAAGAGASESAMRGAHFEAPGMGSMDGARFATSVTPGLATRVALVAQQPLVNRARDARQAQLQGAADMGDAAWRAARSQLMLTTAERYLALAMADERVRVSRGQVAALARARTEAHDRYQMGAAPITDTHEADAALASVRAGAAAAALDASVRRQQLVGSTGLAEPRARLPLRAPHASDGMEHWVRLAEADNPRLRLLAQAVTVAEQKLREQSASGGATLDLIAQAAHERVGGSGSFGAARNRQFNGMLGVQLNIPLSTGGMRQAQEREAAGQLARARAELDLAREETRQQVRAAWLGLQTGLVRITALQQGLKASSARLDATRLGREVGDRTLLDVLGAENDHAQAQLTLAQALGEQSLGWLRLAALADRLDEGSLAEVDALLAPAAQKETKP